MLTHLRIYLKELIVYSFLLQSNPVNTDTEGTAESVHINGVSVLSGSCYQSQKKPFYQNKIPKK